MTTKYQQSQIETAEIISASESLPFAQILSAVKRMCRLQKTLHDYYTYDCNYGLTPVMEKKTTQLEAKITEIANKNMPTIRIEFQNDPRGVPVKLFLSNGKYNSWDGVSWRIPLNV